MAAKAGVVGYTFNDCKPTNQPQQAISARVTLPDGDET